MDADALQSLVAPSQNPPYGANMTTDTARDVAAAAVGYAPAQPTDAVDGLNSGHAQPDHAPLQTRRLPHSTSRSPRQRRSSGQNQVSQRIVPSTSHPGLDDAMATEPLAAQIDATQSDSHLGLTQGEQDGTSQPQNKSGLVWKHSSSAYPKGTPTPTRFAAKSYATPRAAYPSDTWTAQPHTGSGPHTPVNATDDSLIDPAILNNPFSDAVPLNPNPPDLEAWRNKLFNVTEPLVLSEEEFLTYFPHVDNVYSHRSTQKYKRKPFVSHYWDCRLKGRPSGTPKSDDPNKKKRKRQARERDLCDVKIKVTEYFSMEEAAKMGMTTAVEPELPTSSILDSAIDPAIRDDVNVTALGDNGELNIVLQGTNMTVPSANLNTGDPNFGLLELPRRLPSGHPGAGGKRWFTIQRVRGNPGGGAVKDNKRDSLGNATGIGEGNEDEDASTLLDQATDLDHKHTLEESDRIKKNSVQRWLLKEDKEKKRQSVVPTSTTTETPPASGEACEAFSPTFRASGPALSTARRHLGPASSQIIFFSNSFCPFAQRIWIALEIKGLPYQLVEIMPANVDSYRPDDLLEVNADANIPCIRHGNWAVWESGVVLEYLEDLEIGVPLLPIGNPQLRAHCRLWTDHINRKILPSFYNLLLTPPPSRQQQPWCHLNEDMERARNDGTSIRAHSPSSGEARHSMLITTLEKNITELVNASHATGPFFLGSEIGFVDVIFAPWIIRLSRVLSYYRNFPRPEVGTRWHQWVAAVEADDRVRRTVSDENSYHGVYRGVGEDGWDSLGTTDGSNCGTNSIVEIQYAKDVLAREGFGLGGDVWGRLVRREVVAEQMAMDS